MSLESASQQSHTSKPPTPILQKYLRLREVSPTEKDGCYDTPCFLKMTCLGQLEEWKASPSHHLCLDVRPSDDFRKRRLCGSTNIPWESLCERGNELPPKQTPFAIVVPVDRPECVQWLKENGWQCQWVFWEDPAKECFWTLAQQANYSTTGPWTHAPLFNPCRLLKETIDTIEETLGTQRPLECLDIGCGAGRDSVWILSHSPQWKVSAIDSILQCVQKTQAMSEAWGVQDRITVLWAKVLAEGGWRLISAPPPVDSKGRVIGVPTEDFFSFLPTPCSFDLILTIRFFVRSLLPQLPGLLNVGGYLIISHFVEDGVHEYSQPRKDHRLALGELRQFYTAMKNMEILVDEIEEIEDGRPVNSLVLRRLY
ncbi:hypothetical protein BDF14DRAFT_1764806 [Spinellus fusiger]|nr:hypothetical protein BDF14DRAFT_1764806 [Spinellus fusiger]